MSELLRVLVGIWTRRLGPQDLPHSPPLLVRLLLGVIAVQLLIGLMLDATPDSPARLPFSVLMALALPWLLLAWFGKRERYVQTMTALVGTDLLMLLVLAPLLWLAGDMPTPASEPVTLTPAQAFVSLFGLALMGWRVVVGGHIWRHALNWPMAGGVLVALGVFVVDIWLDQALFASSSPSP